MMEKKCFLQEFCIYIKQKSAVCQAGWDVAHLYLGSLTRASFPEVKEIKLLSISPASKLRTSMLVLSWQNMPWHQINANKVL